MTQSEVNKLKRRLAQLTTKINVALADAHRQGLSVFNNSNGYVQLSEGELLTVEIGINECEHHWNAVRTVEQLIATGECFDWTFERCEKCSMTRSVVATDDGDRR